MSILWNNQGAHNRQRNNWNGGQFPGQRGQYGILGNGANANYQPTGQWQQRGFGGFQNHNGQAVQGNNGQQNLAQRQMLTGQQNRQMPMNQQAPQTVETPQGSISYEALDEKSMAQVKELIAKKQDELGIPLEDRKMPTNLTELPKPASIDSSSDAALPKISTTAKLAEIIQGEGNAARFYNNLLDLTGDSYIKNALNEIITNANNRKNLLAKLYNSTTGENYVETHAGIINHPNIREALENAIEIENISARETLSLYDNMEYGSNSKIINSVIHKKIMDINLLQQLAKRA